MRKGEALFVFVFGVLVLASLVSLADTGNKKHVSSVAAAAAASPSLPSCFPAGVRRWEKNIAKWSRAYNLSPTLIAAVMAAESCGNPKAVSAAGAKGLFQVMPFHFTAGENPFDAETNARRGLGYLRWALGRSNGNLRLALATYNMGPAAMNGGWPTETQRYVALVTAIKNEADRGVCQTVFQVCR